MTPTIRVDVDVYIALQKSAEPFVDTPNSVLRRLLKLPDSPAPTAKSREAETQPRTATVRRSFERAKPGTILPHDAYVEPILSTLVKGDGAVSASQVIAEVGRLLGGKLSASDRDRLPSGGFRWENRVQWVRLRLVERGMLSSDSPRGIWEITELGRDFLRRGGGPLLNRR